MKLKAVYSSQKDFYGKANVIVEGGQTKLKSYSTIVAVKENNTIKVRGYYSKTTAIHIVRIVASEIVCFFCFHLLR